MKLYITYMVSPRCQKMVKNELKKMDLHYYIVDPGEVEIMESLSAEQLTQLKTSLSLFGFGLVNEEGAVLIEGIKRIIIETVYHKDGIRNINFTQLLSTRLSCNFAYLTSVFSEVHGTNIEQFITDHKIERIKELILYGELNVTEISQMMNYSSVIQLSNQFRATTGLPLSYFRLLRERKDSPLKEYTSMFTDEENLNGIN